ncbi:MAG: DUF934 domain-containing protein [Gammaproteobacteria bacterium]|nr:DUF934 domain-containing protein [Gammaproteobacteria bacterium]
MRIIKDKKIQQDDWNLINQPDTAGSLPDGDVIVPFAYWKDNQDACTAHKGNVAVMINGDTAITDVASFLDKFELIALDFPAFKDGRCYSHARVLRDRYKYQGDIRAVGDVLRDQLFYMMRCGVSSFAVREDRDMEDALNGLKDFSVTYQSASDDSLPLYKTR